MIVDAASLPSGSALECDICIVGAGAAGITIALELANTPYRVCLLEAGGFRHHSATQALFRGEVHGPAYPELHETRMAALGGSTALWAGWCRPLDPIDFEVRDWISDSGWPFSYEELLPHYRTAHALCGLGPFDYDCDAWQARSGLTFLPVPQDEVTPAMFHISPVRFGATYRQALERSAQTRTLLRANALRFFLDADSNRVQRVSAGTLHGKRIDVKAREFVLASGGIENARLLLLSGDSPETSIGNAHGVVGRYFTEHGFINFGSFIPSDPSSALDFHFPFEVLRDGQSNTVRCGFTMQPAFARRERLLNCALFFHPAYEAHAAFDSSQVRAMLDVWDKLRGRAVPGGYMKHARRALGAPGKLAVAAYRKLFAGSGPQSRWRMRSLFECLADRNNRIDLATRKDALGRPLPRITWRLSELDLRSVRCACQTLDRSLRRAGLGHLEFRFPEDSAAWSSGVEAGKHHMGTTRMHLDPRRGVVDSDCKVHGIANLYVAGSSVFPTGGFANPTLTVVALAARLAAHLRRDANAS